MKDCKRPASMAQKVSAIPENNRKSAKHILSEICHQVAEVTMEETHDIDPEKDQSKHENQDTDLYPAQENFNHRPEGGEKESEYNKLSFLRGIESTQKVKYSILSHTKRSVAILKCL